MSKDIWWIFFVFILIGIAWNLQRSGKILPQTSPTTQESKTATSTLKQYKIEISPEQVFEEKPEAEYISLQNADYETKKDFVISELTLKNKGGNTAVIGKDLNEKTISLKNNERTIIISGKNPKENNFKLNKCSGYFEQSNSFTPPISTPCPRIANLTQAENLKNSCIDFLDSLPACQTPKINFEGEIDQECGAFFSKHANYAGCVEDHKNDPDFDLKEWRIYLGKTTEFWSNRHDTIKLLDQNGNLVSELAY